MVQIINDLGRLITTLFVFSLCLYVTPNEIEAKQVIGPLVWDMKNLESLKLGQDSSLSVKSIIDAADKYCMIQPVTIITKTSSFISDHHYFCSIGPYWWPDTSHPGKYILKDGYVNPESNEYDNSRLTKLVNRCRRLSYAFYITEDIKYYNAFVAQLKAWFIAKDTYMYPNFKYSQVTPGQNGNRGVYTGMITAYPFNSVIESIRLVNSVKKIDSKTMRALKKWFLSFANWSIAEYGQRMSIGKNNISTAFDVTMVNMLLFAGKKRRAKSIANEFAEKRIIVQIHEDGSQPSELSRSKAFYYSLYNVSHFLDFCYIVRYWDEDYYSKNGSRIDMALDYLQSFADSPDEFPYQELTDWVECLETLNILMQRRDILRSVVKNSE